MIKNSTTGSTGLPGAWMNLRKLKRALGYASHQRSSIVAILFLTLLISGLGVAEPLIMKYIFDNLAAVDINIITVMKGGLLLLAGALLREVLAALSNWLTWRTRLRLHYGLLGATVERLYLMPVDAHRQEGVGAVMTKLERGIQGFIGAISDLAFNVLPAIAYLFLSVCIMFALDWRITLLVLAFVPVPIYIQSRVAPKQTSREKHLMEKWGQIYSRFNEVLSGIITVRSFSMEKYEKERFLNGVNRANGVVVKGISYDSGVSAVQNLVTILARISALCFGGFLVYKGQITVGTVIAFLGYVGSLFGPVQGLTSVYRSVRVAGAALDHIFSILDSQEMVEDAPDAKEVTGVTGEIEFRRVVFAYKGTAGPLLKEVSFHIKAGETVAIVGPSGSGKTTLMSLLQRFYEVDSGAILVDNTDIRSLKQTSLRKNIGVVLQDTLLFNDTIRNNIAYGSFSASKNDIIEAAKAANAHEFIMKLEKGYDTKIGEKGAMLSMGERQRVAIARALLKNPHILILDEATSALDAELEAMVQTALNRLIENRTTIIIAHRLATVVNADRILVFRDGQIVEVGRHKQLLEQNGYYASLVEKQTRDLVIV